MSFTALASVLFSMILMSACSGLLVKLGAISAFFATVTKAIKGPWSARFLTISSGILCFFDHRNNGHFIAEHLSKSKAANFLSREKLAYFAHTTGSVTASLALISTLAITQVALLEIAVPELRHDSYRFFIASLPYNFYAWFSLALVVVVALTGNLGHIKKTQSYSQKADTPIEKLLLFYVPMLCMLMGTALCLVVNKNQDNSYGALLVGSSLALFASMFIVVVGKMAEPQDIASFIGSGISFMLPSLGCVLLAWLIAHLATSLGLSDVLYIHLASYLHPSLMPTLIFALAALLGRATHSSGLSSALLMPICIPLVFLMTNQTSIQLASASAIFGGSLFGSHCTKLSFSSLSVSLGAQCQAEAHIKSQTPYALIAALLSIVFGTLPLAFRS